MRFDVARHVLIGVIGVVVVIGLFVLVFVATCASIGSSVADRCEDARKEYGGGCVDALMELVEDEGQSYEDRNGAVWALGQLGEERALSVLESYYTGDIPDREPIDESISQHELSKAIKLCEGSVNLSAVVWRRGEF